MPRRSSPPPDGRFTPKAAKKIPFDFVLDELASLHPRTNPMFGCQAVYVGEKIVLILRDRLSVPADNGVWVATTREHHAALLSELPSMRGITVLGDQSSAWQLIPKDTSTFEEEVLHACALIRARDARIGKVPKPKRKAAPSAAPKTKTPKTKTPKTNKRSRLPR
jgi:hypothetical protein